MEQGPARTIIFHRKAEPGRISRVTFDDGTVAEPGRISRQTRDAGAELSLAGSQGRPARLMQWLSLFISTAVTPCKLRWRERASQDALHHGTTNIAGLVKKIVAIF